MANRCGIRTNLSRVAVTSVLAAWGATALPRLLARTTPTPKGHSTRHLRYGVAGQQAVRARSLLAGLKVMNYYPAQNGWTYMWTRWDPAGLDADLNRIASLNANAVRIIIQTWTFGYPAPHPTMQDHLAQMVALAQRHG